MKNNLLCILIILLFFLSVPYFMVPYKTEEITEGFRGGRGNKRGGGNRNPGKRGGNRSPGKRGGNRSPGKRGGNRSPGRKVIRHGGRGWRRGLSEPHYYRRSGYRRYPYNYYYGGNYGYPYYSPYDFLGLPYTWGSPYGYTTYNWFDYRNCPSGCVANLASPTGFSCRGSNTSFSCLTDYDCSGCNNPLVTSYY